MNKLWILKLSPNQIQFISKTSHLIQSTIVCELKVESLFEDFRIESLHQNEIYLELSAEDLSKVFRSEQIETSMKLTKSDQLPVLLFSITAHSRVGKNVYLNQGVPVKVLTESEKGDIKEPVFGRPEVSILLPSITQIKNILDKLKSLSNTIKISANRKGECRFQIDSEHATVETFFKDLKNLEYDDDQEIDIAEQDPAQFIGCSVDAKDLVKMTHVYHLSPKSIVGCIQQDCGLLIYVYLGNSMDSQDYFGTLTFRKFLLR